MFRKKHITIAGLSLLTNLIASSSSLAVSLTFTPLQNTTTFNSFRATFSLTQSDLCFTACQVNNNPEGFPPPPTPPPPPPPPPPPLTEADILQIEAELNEELNLAQQKFIDELNEQLQNDLDMISEQMKAKLGEDYPKALLPNEQPAILPIPSLTEEQLRLFFLPSVQTRRKNSISFQQNLEIIENQCIPEPSTVLSLFALGTLGAASTLKRKLKSSQSTEKETTKVG
ncbi:MULTISPECIES: PEP-CTERM sorting domain-containing protein [unclassified Microcystis]|uniref:PEP-CTERM sorting domain-containing protein n=1 Tax=unclassified Microcystis TaxID=2643300 RepID=UPI0022C51A14|nr:MULTISPECIES: PEP-CTERM sorting domain-containing protein [unclassified Microcystis]MCZ8202226.1 PEP-CTERM sorting domain-containing protein [Microcystis sp. LE19-55.1A]MCZ8305270.1 PEP-CTERM sorting domain-containing protein [Microcystis sp. LE19-98.1E]